MREKITPLVTAGLANAMVGYVAEHLLCQRNAYGHSFKVFSAIPSLNTKAWQGMAIGVILIAIDSLSKSIFCGFLKHFGYLRQDQESHGQIAKLRLFSSIYLTSLLSTKLFSLNKRDTITLTVAIVVLNIVFSHLANEFNKLYQDVRDQAQSESKKGAKSEYYCGPSSMDRKG
jgi:VanZ family protein